LLGNRSSLTITNYKGCTPDVNMCFRTKVMNFSILVYEEQ